jgi:hypothetical protein
MPESEILVLATTFFPKDAFGGPNRDSKTGVPVNLYPKGLPGPVKTDIPTRGNSGKPRWIEHT